MLTTDTTTESTEKNTIDLTPPGPVPEGFVNATLEGEPLEAVKRFCAMLLAECDQNLGLAVFFAEVGGQLLRYAYEQEKSEGNES